MATDRLSVVTGAFGYTGRYIAQRLIANGERVKTLTSRFEQENPFGEKLTVEPYRFDDPGALAASLEGADVLYNTYWVRFPRGKLTFDVAVARCRALIEAAERAGVKRIVHVSITNPSADSRLPYFRGKGLVEEAVTGSSLTYAIVRPALVFGEGDILINNVAWAVRRFPIFPLAGSGLYRVQPVFVDDVAGIAVDAGRLTDNLVIDAVGPETFTFAELVSLIADKIGARTKIVSLAPGVALFLSRVVGWLVRDEVLTREEVEGLMDGLLYTGSPPTAKTRLSDWLTDHADSIGRTYASELRRHYR